MRRHDAALDSQTELEGGGHEEKLEARGFEPSYATFTPIPHYHGDTVRLFLLGAAALLLFASPLYADSLKDQFPFLVFGAFVSVAVAALTDPHKRLSLMADAVVSGVGMTAYAGWGLLGYESADLVAFVLRLAVAAIFLFAFYFSLKTVRAFALGEVGRRDRFGVLSDTDRGDS